jgi:Zn-dependent peptidase ImmA (M78 family)
MVRPKKARRHTVPKRRVSVETSAANILAALGCNSAPIPVERVARELGLEVQRANLGDDISGLLVIKDGHGLIGVGATQSLGRQRFTIAHEIAHFVLHKDMMPVFIDRQFLRPYFAAFRDLNSSTGEDALEREANGFAASLLMPADVVRRAVRELGQDVTDDAAIEELAEQFQVSRQAMTFRLANLSISPVSLT